MHLGFVDERRRKRRVWKKPQVKDQKPSTEQQQQNRRTNSGQTQNQELWRFCWQIRAKILLLRATRISESLQRKYGRSCTKQGAKTPTNNNKRREEKAMVAVAVLHMFYIVAVATSAGNAERNTWRGAPV
jgi:hypothetical protein